MHTTQQIETHIKALLPSNIRLQCVTQNNQYLSIQFLTDACTYRALRVYYLGDTVYRVETSEIMHTHHLPESYDKDLTDDLAGWLTDFIKVGVFTIADTTPSTWQPLPNDQLVMLDFPEIEQIDIMQLVRELPDAYDTFEYIKEWEIECGKVEKTPEQIAADELDLKEWNDYFMQQEAERKTSQTPQVEQEKTADDLAWEEACRADDEAWQNGQAKLIEQILETRNRASTKIQAEKVDTQITITQDQLDTYWFAWHNINTDTPFISFVALLYPLTKLDTLEVIRYELTHKTKNQV